jgi:nucleotide-binding universal stress UspA family protein
MNLPQSILVALDLGDQAAQLLAYAAALADKLDTKLHVLHAVDWPQLGAELPAAVSDQAMDQIVAQHRQDLLLLVATHAGKASLGSVELKMGDPRSVITQTAEQLHAGLIVMGTHGRRGVSRVLLGSVAERTSRTGQGAVRATCSATATAPAPAPAR